MIDAVAQRLGIVRESAGEGRAVLRMKVTAEALNGGGVAHGGVIFTLADTALIHACIDERPLVTSWANIVFVSTAAANDELVATATVITRFGSNVVCDVTVRGGAGAVVAELRGNCRYLRP